MNGRMSTRLRREARRIAAARNSERTARNSERTESVESIYWRLKDEKKAKAYPWPKRLHRSKRKYDLR